jgi:hypothetical protein
MVEVEVEREVREVEVGWEEVEAEREVEAGMEVEVEREVEAES